MEKSTLQLATWLLGIVPIVLGYDTFISHSTPHYKYSIFGGSPKGSNYRISSSQLLQEPIAPFGGILEQFSSPFINIQPPQQIQPDNNPNRCGVRPPTCLKSRYRTLDGSCNNLKNPSWGSANSTYERLLPANYADGISLPTDFNNPDYPLPRVVSLVLFPDVPIKDPLWTLAAMQYGQIITHDMAMIGGSTQSMRHPQQCCTPEGQLLDAEVAPKSCYPILIPENDPVLSKSNTRCHNFVRSDTDLSRQCSAPNKPAEQITVVSAFLDAHIIYGQSPVQNAQLRSFQGGRLLTENKQGREFPPSAPNKQQVCNLQNVQEACYVSGDVRINQNPQLTILHVIMIREHNRIANYLQHINPHWTDETVFQEARRILIAQHQHISYVEWLPIFLGMKNLLNHHVIYQTDKYVNDYNENISPNIINEHSTTAFRYFHSAIAGHLELLSPHRGIRGAARLSDWFDRPQVIEDGNNFDDLTRGMGTQPEMDNDKFFTSEITQYLFRGNSKFGQDLRAIDIQRNRDHGLASYNDYRHFCGLPKARSFEDLLDVISQEDVEKLASLYKSPDEIDLTVGGSLEAHVPGALAGPTFLCIMTEQFYRTRVGDRYWYESPETDIAFTIEQLNEIRKATISRWFCDNGDNINHMQPRGFEVISKTNEVMDCQALPAINLDLWKDISPIQHDSNYGFDYDFKK